MSVLSTEPAPVAVCPVCHAEQKVAGQPCWLCGAAAGQHATSSAPAARPGSHHVGYSYSLGTLLLVTTLFALCCGLFSVAPGLGVIVSILLVPVLVRTIKVVRRREEAGLSVSAAEKISLGVTSFAVTAVIAAVVGFATFCCFCATCAMLFGLGSNDAGLVALAVGVAFAAAVAIFITTKLVKWSRRRYQRDIGAAPPGDSSTAPSDSLPHEP